MSRRVIFDTDPGVDDAMALFFLLQSPEFELEAVTTVFGNVDVEQTTRNALILLDVAGRADIPVAPGAGRPLMPHRQRQLGGAVVHGDNGLGGADLPKPSRAAGSQRAAELIVERVMAAPGEITLIAVGPLTNVALATCLEPRIVEHVRELIVMGGAATVPGNVTPLAEANFHNDPEAAAIVVAAGYRLALIGLDVTLQAIITPEQVDTARDARRHSRRVHPRHRRALWRPLRAPDRAGSGSRCMTRPPCSTPSIRATFRPTAGTWRSRRPARGHPGW